ncbi:5192_t:CDS:2 [Paraglomus occultum]|uniref:5192_t:CDS:1 n=1 Tax=Paraglomus occultum TaxID=144539 RepID=A0A9N8W7Z0_9GLOM|nr:5192_t:CDS:2 [Paraglomus occultum]
MDARNRSSLVNSSQLSPSPFRHNIPEFSSFEHQKENILPLKEGRSAASLSEVFSKDHALRTTQLASAHATFAAELDTLDELDDPLDVFNRYIKWTIENYPQGHNHESNLIPLLERATRTFKDDERYKKDPRYLRLWLLYAKYVEHPRDIFVFLENNEIGQDLAAFYEEYGALLESVKRFKEADQIYQLGIHRRARPLERLKRRFAAFQARVTVSYNPAETEDVQSLDPLAENPRRTVLGVKTSASSTRSAPQNVFNARDLNKSSALQSGNEAGSRQGGMASGISDRKLPIYYDPDGQRASTVLDGPISNTPWRDYGTELSRRQENIQESTKWKGVTLPMGRSPRTPLSEKFQVYCDKEEVREVQSSVVEQPPDVNTSTKVDNSQSKHNDTRNVTSNTQNPSREPTKCVPYPRCHMKSTSMILAEIKQFGDKVAADVYSVYADDDEFCFEEIRANSKALFVRIPEGKITGLSAITLPPVRQKFPP